jgi:hypothetical protein
MKALPIAALTGALIATGAFVVARHVTTATPIDWSSAQRVEIRMIEYEFLPNQLRLRRGLPYQLHLVNAGKEGHDFTAPDFFTSHHFIGLSVGGARETLPVMRLKSPLRETFSILINL